ncbi:MAG: lipoate--protein ligase [Bacteroidales bacterium]|nr:lipoate--protein ligase [Bacteroidales bacterium]
MIFINKDSLDPWFNLAAEEYVLKNRSEDIFMLWQNTACVVIGKHQNAMGEINAQFIAENNIPVIRRITGGGTVFHDLNNLNYTFVTNCQAGGNQVDFKKYTLPVITYLQSLGVPAQISGKSNITVDGLKVSGNAAHVFKNRTIHHGTLLFDTDLNLLENIIQPSMQDFDSKAIPSVKAKVTNISSHLARPLSMPIFTERLKKHIQRHFQHEQSAQFTVEEREKINALANEKYKTWDWNFGYSPDYMLTKNIESDYGVFRISLSVHKGIVAKCEVEGLHNAHLASLLIKLLKDSPHYPGPASRKIENFASIDPALLKGLEKILHQLI